MGAILIDCFEIDHDRENMASPEVIRNEYQRESDYLEEAMLQKYVSGELDTVTLSRLLRRKADVDYFIGRYDGEKLRRNSND